MRRTISLIIISALALLSWWFQDIWKEAPIIQVKKDSHFPDYFMENFTLTSMDDKGKPAYILKAKRMEHFADDDSAELIQPTIEFLDDNNTRNWIISAQRAQLTQKQNIIHLYDDVLLQREKTSQQNDLTISTDDLVINTEKEIADTDKTAIIKTGALELSTLGMVFDGKQGILKLKSRVKGIYETAR